MLDRDNDNVMLTIHAVSLNLNPAKGLKGKMIKRLAEMRGNVVHYPMFASLLATDFYLDLERDILATDHNELLGIIELSKIRFATIDGMLSRAMKRTG